MSAHFTVSEGIAHEARGFSPARKGKGTLAVWGLVLGGLLFGVTMVAAVAVSTWAEAGSIY